MNSFLPVGKLNNKLLQDLLSEINNAGPTPKIGEDSAIISIRDQEDLLVSSDPITSGLSFPQLTYSILLVSIPAWAR